MSRPICPRTAEVLRAAEDAFGVHRTEEEQRAMHEQGRHVSEGIQQGGVMHVLRHSSAGPKPRQRFNFAPLIETIRTAARAAPPGTTTSALPPSPSHAGAPQITLTPCPGVSSPPRLQPPALPEQPYLEALTPRAGQDCPEGDTLLLHGGSPSGSGGVGDGGEGGGGGPLWGIAVQAAMTESRRLLVDVAQLQHQKAAKGKEAHRGFDRLQSQHYLPAVDRPDTPEAVRQLGGQDGATMRRRKRRSTGGGVGAPDASCDATQPPEGAREAVVLGPVTNQVVARKLRQSVSQSHRRVQRCRYGSCRVDTVSSEELKKRCGSSMQSLMCRLYSPQSGAVPAITAGPGAEEPSAVALREDPFESPFKMRNVITPREDIDSHTQALPLTARLPPKQQGGASSSGPEVRRPFTAGDAAALRRQRVVEEIDEAPPEDAGCETDAFITQQQQQGVVVAAGGGGGGGVADRLFLEGSVAVAVAAVAVAAEPTSPLPPPPGGELLSHPPEAVQELAAELSFQECGTEFVASGPGCTEKIVKRCNRHNEGVVLPDTLQGPGGAEGWRGGEAGGRYCLNYRRGADQHMPALRPEPPSSAARKPVPYESFRRTLHQRGRAMNARSVRELERCEHRRRIFFARKYEVLAMVFEQAMGNSARFTSWAPAAAELNRAVVHVAVARDSHERKERRDAFVSRARGVVAEHFPDVQDCGVLLDRLARLFEAEEDRIRAAVVESVPLEQDDAMQQAPPLSSQTSSVLSPKPFFDLLSTFATARLLQDGFCAFASLLRPLFRVTDAMWQQYLKDRFDAFEAPSVDALLEQQANCARPLLSAKEGGTARAAPARLKIKVQSARGVDPGGDPAASQMMVQLRCGHMWREAPKTPTGASPPQRGGPEVRISRSSEEGGADVPLVASGIDAIAEPLELRGDHKTSVVHGTRKPVWNEEFVLALQDERAVLELSLYDLRDVRNRPIGTATLNIASDLLKLRANVRSRVCVSLRNNSVSHTKRDSDHDTSSGCVHHETGDAQVRSSMSHALALSPKSGMCGRASAKQASGVVGELVLMLQPLNFFEVRQEVRPRKSRNTSMYEAAQAFGGPLRRVGSRRLGSAQPPDGGDHHRGSSSSRGGGRSLRMVLPRNLSTVSVADGPGGGLFYAEGGRSKNLGSFKRHVSVLG